MPNAGVGRSGRRSTHSLSGCFQRGQRVPLGVWAGGHTGSNENLNNKMTRLASGTARFRSIV